MARSLGFVLALIGGISGLWTYPASASIEPWGYIDAIRFRDEMQKLAVSLGLKLRLEPKRCDRVGCIFEGDDFLSVTINYHRSISVEWNIVSSNKVGPRVLITALQSLLNDDDKVQKIMARSAAAVGENPAFSTFDAFDYTVRQRIIGSTAFVHVDAMKSPDAYRPQAK
jgi:hypothetical protein